MRELGGVRIGENTPSPENAGDAMRECVRDFCVLLCDERMTLRRHGQDIEIPKNHQALIDCRKEGVTFLSSGTPFIMIDIEVIREFILSLKRPTQRMYAQKDYADIPLVECRDVNVFHLAHRYMSISNQTEDERYCARSLLFAVLSFFMVEPCFLPRLIHSMNSSVTFSVQEVITRNVGYDWRLDAVARTLFMSPSSLKRHLKLEGAHYNKIVVQCRMEHAATLLRIEHNTTISALAYQCGYRHRSYFIQAFKKYHGVTPYQFDKKGGLRSQAVRT